MPHPREGLIQTLLIKKQYSEAIAEYEELARMTGTFDQQKNVIKEVRDAFLAEGEKGFWQKKLELDLRGGIESAFDIAWDYASLGKIDQSFEWLTKAIEIRDPGLDELEVDPRFDSLRSDPRFKNCLRSMNLE